MDVVGRGLGFFQGFFEGRFGLGLGVLVCLFQHLPVENAGAQKLVFEEGDAIHFVLDTQRAARGGMAVQP